MKSTMVKRGLPDAENVCELNFHRFAGNRHRECIEGVPRARTDRPQKTASEFSPDSDAGGWLCVIRELSGNTPFVGAWLPAGVQLPRWCGRPDRRLLPVAEGDRQSLPGFAEGWPRCC